MSFDRPDFELLVTDFAPGFLDTPETNALPKGATPDARNGWLVHLNVVSGARAKLAKRPGSQLLNPAAIASGAKVDGLFEVRRSDGSRDLLAVCDGKLWAFDGADTFDQVGATAPFTAGHAARAVVFNDQAFVFDGTAQQRTDGTTLYDVGQAAPTGVTDLSAVAASGSGVSGTFEALYTWYDPTMDHESSPSDITPTPVTLSGQARRHTQPGGSPGASYTQWRAYVRRTDTNETLFGRVGTWDVGSGTHDEETIDAARRISPPAVNAHNPPPGAWAILVEWKGRFLGVQANSSQLYVSRAGDPQSWDPADSLFVRRGDGEPITGIKAFGADVLIQKPHRTWRLTGEAMPFVPEPVHSAYGGVSQESGCEVDGVFFDWDRERGPYRTDGLAFRALAEGTIQTIVASVNRAALSDIRCVHAETYGLIGWAIPTGAQSRKRTLLWYNYLLDCWLPPWTGLEYGALATWTDSAGQLGVYLGDHWGRVHQLFTGDREGVPNNAAVDLVAEVTSATSDSVTASGATFYTDGDGLAGLPVAVISPAGVWQWRRVLSNTATTITLDTTHDAAWTTTPEAGWTVVVGGIDWYQWTPVYDLGLPHVAKQLHWLYLQGKATSEEHEIAVHARFNDDEGTSEAVDVAYPTGSLSGVWGTAIWGTSLWGTISRRIRKHRVGRTAVSAQFRLSNARPDEPITVTLFGFSGDVVGPRKVASV